MTITRSVGRDARQLIPGGMWGDFETFKIGLPGQVEPLIPDGEAGASRQPPCHHPKVGSPRQAALSPVNLSVKGKHPIGCGGQGRSCPSHIRMSALCDRVFHGNGPRVWALLWIVLPHPGVHLIPVLKTGTGCS